MFINYNVIGFGGSYFAIFSNISIFRAFYLNF